MLRYFAQKAGIDCIAIRFPWILEDEPIGRLAQRNPKDLGNPREGFSWLHAQDAARLIDAALRASLPGFRIYFVAAPQNITRQPLPELIAQHYANVPLRVPADQINALVDISQVTQQTGWTPQLTALPN